MTAEPHLDTSKRFGFEWDRYRDFFPHYEEQFRGWIDPLGPQDFAGREVLDAGCGMGRNSYWAARYGARRVVAVDQAELAVAAAREALAGLPNVRVERESIYDLAYEEAFDLCFSIGVIHHLEFPRRALGRLIRHHVHPTGTPAQPRKGAWKAARSTLPGGSSLPPPRRSGRSRLRSASRRADQGLPTALRVEGDV